MDEARWILGGETTLKSSALKLFNNIPNTSLAVNVVNSESSNLLPNKSLTRIYKIVKCATFCSPYKKFKIEKFVNIIILYSVIPKQCSGEELKKIESFKVENTQIPQQNLMLVRLPLLTT